MIHIYICSECEEEYHHEEKGTYYCNWYECENEEPLECFATKEATA